MELDCAVDVGWSAATDWEALANRAAGAATQVAPELDNPRLCASILFTGDEDIRILNREWRGKDKSTNVLSFPMMGRSELLELSAEGPPAMIGDIALAQETCSREAKEKGAEIADHAVHLIVHGLLHLAGLDHESGEEEAEAMEALEIKALALLGIANPYEH